MEALLGEHGGGSFVWGPKYYIRKALGLNISLHWGLSGQTIVGSTTGDFEI
jgi:hypothetical protein